MGGRGRGRPAQTRTGGARTASGALRSADLVARCTASVEGLAVSGQLPAGE